MAFDPSLLEPESAFDPSLLTPEETPFQPRVEEIPETAGSTLSHYWDKAQQKLVTLAPRFNRHTVPDALDVLDSWSPERFLAPPGVIAPDDLGAPSREPTPAEQRATGVYNATADAVNSMTSPVGIATLGMGALPKTAQVLATAGFLAQTANATEEAAKQAGEASVTGTPEQRAEAYAALGLQGTMGALIAHQGAGLLRPKPITPAIERTPNASEVSPSTKVHGDVYSQPREGEGQVPVQEGESGIQSQTEGGLQENPAPEVQRNVAAAEPQRVTEPQRAAIETSNKVWEMSPDEFMTYSQELQGKGGFTRAAYDVGASAPDQAFVDALRARADAFDQKWRDTMKSLQGESDMAKKMATLDQVSKLSAQKQFFEEAWQYATGKGSGGESAVKEGHQTKFIAKENVPARAATPEQEPLPLTEFKGEVPADHVPIKVQRPDGSTYEAYLAGRPGEKMAGTKIAKVKAETKDLSHGVLGKGDQIIEGPKTAEEYTAAIRKPTEAGHEIAPGVLIDPFLYHTAIKPTAQLAVKGAKAAYSNKHVQAQVQALNRRRQAFSTLFRALDNRKLMDQTMDAADNQAVITGQQVRKGLELGAPKADQNAASAIIAAGFDPAKLPDLLTKAQAGKNAEAIKAVQDAMAQYSRLEPLAKRGQADFDGQIQEENWHGINTEYHEDYLPGIYDQDLWMGGKRPFVVAGGGTGISTGFKKGKTFATPFDAIEAGYTPKSIALAELAEHRVRAGQRLINRKRWADGLRTELDPTDQKPIVTDLLRKPRGPGQPAYEVAPPGYRVQEIIPGQRLAVHEVYVPLFKALTGESAIASSVPGRIALETVGGIKHGLLAFDTFHASRIAQKQAVLGLKLPSYTKGVSLLEYADQDLSRAVQEGVITPDIAAWAQAQRPVAQRLIASGLNVGRVSEALYTSFVRQIPGIGHFNKWVFEKLTRGAMLESALTELERVSRKMPNVPPEQVARTVARDLNAYYGNLGRQGFFKSKTMQDMARIIALAPQWVEAMARTEAKGFLQGVKGVTYDPLMHKTVMVGSLGKAMGQGLLAYFVATQLLNLATRRKPTWENQEEGHELDAWIPSVDGKGNGFFMSPLAIPAELTHDLLKYSKKDGTALKAAAHILSNKSSSPVRAVAALATGKSFWSDPKTDDTWGRVKKAVWSLNPTPIPVQPLEHKSFPGQLQRQVTASLGVKTEPAESPVQQIGAKAKAFMEKQGKKPLQFELTDDPSYFKLRSALRADNVKEAQNVMDELLKSHTRQQLFKAMERNVLHPFTGSVAQEGKFKRTLTPAERQLYQQAVNDRREEFRKFKQFRSGSTPASTTPASSGFDPQLLTPE